MQENGFIMQFGFRE